MRPFATASVAASLAAVCFASALLACSSRSAQSTASVPPRAPQPSAETAAGAGAEADEAPASDEPTAAERRIAQRAGAPLLSGMGTHTRPISTEHPVAQRLFDQGLMMHFGFNHAEAHRSFLAASEIDPSCGVCYAFAAVTLGPNINAPMDPDRADTARALVRQARARADDETERERAYIEAIAARFLPAGDGPSNDAAYAEATGELVAADPRDDDAATLHAEALMVMHPWDYWTRSGAPRAWTPRILNALETVLQRSPEHPFANHLYIHAVEASSEPERALPSARRLEDQVPGAGHLVHMPAHVYIRTGNYHAASTANERAIAADQAYLAQVEAQGLYPLAYYPHNYHFLWATTTLEGRSADALAAARGLAERVDRERMDDPGMATLQHYLVTPHYARVAFGRWEEILTDQAPVVPLPYPRAVWHYARGMASAARGNPRAAGEHLRHLRKALAADAFEGVTIWDINETRDLIEIAAALLAAEIARAGGDHADAIEHLQRAVRLEDALAYDEPPPWGPATRRYLGAALLEAGRPEAAEAVYREDLARFPANGWSLYGLMAALRAQGRTEEAAVVQGEFRHAWRHADVELTASRM